MRETGRGKERNGGRACVCPACVRACVRVCIPFPILQLQKILLSFVKTI